MVRLSQMALSSSTLLSINQPPLFQVTSASAWLLNPNNMATLVIRPPAAPGDPGATNTDKQALKVEDFTDIVDCLKNAQYSWSWGWFVLSICIPKSCADRFVDLLSLGSGTLLGAGVALVTKGLTAAVASAGGYVALAIMLSALYWAAMIHFNETAKGVCLHIPMPWSFGVIGPGWAEGIK
jgi:hypothetical protein